PALIAPIVSPGSHAPLRAPMTARALGDVPVSYLRFVVRFQDIHNTARPPRDHQLSPRPSMPQLQSDPGPADEARTRPVAGTETIWYSRACELKKSSKRSPYAEPAAVTGAAAGTFPPTACWNA